MSQPTEIDNTELKEKAYMCANVMAAGKERAIKRAFDAYFERHDWTEADLVGLELAVEIDPLTLSERFVIDGRPMLQFGRIECHTEIEGNTVQCLFHQSVKVLYEACGV